jgi:hypothetical protein
VIRARRESSMLGDTRRDCRACVGRTRTATKTRLPDEGRPLLDHLSREGVCVFIYVLGVAWSFAQPTETSYI